MATLNPVKVKGDKFEPASQRGNTNDVVQFKNKRSQSVTVTLLSGFFSPNTITLQPEGQSGDSANVTVTGTAGTGTFKAPKSSGSLEARAAQTENDIKGDITVNPSR